jgi:hypothetical protein
MDGETYKVLINSNLYTEGNAIPHNPVFGIHNQTDNIWAFAVRSNGTVFMQKPNGQNGIVLKDGEISVNGSWEAHEEQMSFLLLKFSDGATTYGMYALGDLQYNESTGTGEWVFQRIYCKKI